MITKQQISRILEGYDKENITIGTIGSHSAMQILYGAKDENFKTIVIGKKKNLDVYKRFNIGDSVVEVENYRDLLYKENQAMLKQQNVVLIPHGSFVEYLKSSEISDNLEVPLMGNRLTLEWEADRKKVMKWIQRSGINTPVEFESPSDIDRLCIVKLPGAKGGEGYFLVAGEDDFYENLKILNKKLKQLNKSEIGIQDCIIQEYIIGTRIYPHYFYSPITGECELMSADLRYESNADGITRIPGNILKNYDIKPSYVVVGNTPLTIRESLLPAVFEMGESLVETSKKLFAGGLTGPFCIETVCTPELEFIAFEVSARIVAGTNLYPRGSNYSWIKHGEPMSTGRRIAREIKTAIKKDALGEIIY